MVSTKSGQAKPDEAQRPDDLPTVGQPRMRGAGVAAQPVGAVVLGEVKSVRPQNHSGPVGLRVGPQFVAGGQHDQVGGMLDAVDGPDPGAGDPLDGRGDQVRRRVVERG